MSFERTGTFRIALAMSIVALAIPGGRASAGEPVDPTHARWAAGFSHPGGKGFDGTVEDLLPTPAGLYATGNFAHAGSTSAAGIALLSGETWSRLGSAGFDGLDRCGFGCGKALAVLGGAVYVAGGFEKAGGAFTYYVGRWNGSWSGLGTGLSALHSDAVAVLGDSVYYGGYFSGGGSASSSNIIRWSTTTQTWHAMGGGTDSPASVNAIVPHGLSVYIGGSFTAVGGSLPARGVARWDTQFGGEWRTLGSPLSNGVDGTVAAMLVHDGSLYVGGSFSQTAGQATSNLARFDLAAETWHPVGVGFDGPVLALATIESDLYVGGAFSEVGGAPARNVVRYRSADASWHALGGAPGGVDGEVRALAPDGRTLWLGGSFTEAGGVPSMRIARYDARDSADVTLAREPAASVANQTVVLSAMVGNASATGTVAFLVDGATIPGCASIAVVDLPQGRGAQCETTALPVGTPQVAARYGGDASRVPDESAAQPHVVTAPSLAIAPETIAAAVAGVPYAATLSTSGTGGRAPYTYSQSAGALPPGISVLSNGQVSGISANSGVFEFEVDATDDSSMSVGGPFSTTKDYTLVVARQSTSVAIASISPDPVVQGQLYTVSVSVQGSHTTPTGVVNVSDGANGACVAALSSGAGQCTMSSSLAGARTITASYAETPTHGFDDAERILQVGSSVGGSTSRVTVGTRTGVRGETVAVPVVFRGDGTTVQVTAQISFDKDQLAFVGAQPIGGAVCARLVAPNDDRVSLLAPGTPTGQPLSPNLDSRYCELTFRILSTTPGGVYPLGIVNSQCQDAGGINRSCLNQNGSINVAALETSAPAGSLLAISGYAADVSASRSVRVSNLGDVARNINCTVVGDSALSLSQGAALQIEPQQRATIEVACLLPELGTSRSGQLVCSTNDPVRPSLQFGVSCTRVADGTPLPEDQIFDDALKAGDQLGTSADVSTSAATQIAVLGAPFAGSDVNGRVVIMESAPGAKRSAADRRDGMLGWRGVAVLSGPRERSKGFGGVIGDKFGQAVAVAPDGSRIAVGAPLGGPQGSGRVHVYVRPPGGWVDVDVTAPHATLDAPTVGGYTVSEFGGAVAFAADGRLAIGAPGSSAGASGLGLAFVFAPTSSAYERTDTLTSLSPQSQGRFGAAVAIGTDALGAGHLVIGAPQEGPLGPIAERPGNAYIVPLVAGAVGIPARIEQADVVSGDKFGSSVDVAGGVVVVGAEGDDTEAGPDSGSARVYRPSSGALGAPSSRLLVPEDGDGQGAGAAVATNGDVILVGAPLASVGGVRQGRAYLYMADAPIAAAMRPGRVVENSDAGEGDSFGRALAVNARDVLAGVPLDDREIAPGQIALDIGRGDAFVLDQILRSGFE